jgi:hypothetical protein
MSKKRRTLVIGISIILFIAYALYYGAMYGVIQEREASSHSIEAAQAVATQKAAVATAHAMQNLAEQTAAAELSSTSVAILYTQVSIYQTLTATFQATMPTATFSPTPTYTPSSGELLGTQIAATSTVAAALTKAANAQLVFTNTPMPATPILSTANPTMTIRAAFGEVDTQFQNTLKSNLAFNKPGQMKKDDTTTIELILNPSLSKADLATQLVDQGGFATSTAEPNVLIAPNGEKVTVTTSQIEITPRMKAVLLPQDPEAFTVTSMHDNAEQVVSSVTNTTWRWSVTAKKEGSQMLELVIYQLVKYDGKEFWHEVETYKANILVEVTPKEWFQSWWAATIGAITAIAAIIISFQSICKWFEERKKKAAESEPPAPVRRIK